MSTKDLYGYLKHLNEKRVENKRARDFVREEAELYEKRLEAARLAYQNDKNPPKLFNVIYSADKVQSFEARYKKFQNAVKAIEAAQELVIAGIRSWPLIYSGKGLS